VSNPKCEYCGAELTVDNLNPTAFAAQAEKDGWHLDPRYICCNRKQRQRPLVAHIDEWRERSKELLKVCEQ
jgi:hypothetical protein